MKNTTLCLCLAALVVGCAPTKPREPLSAIPSTADAAFDALSRRYFDQVLALQPVNATGLGDHRYDNQLDDVSSSGRERTLTVERDLLRAVRALDRARLS